jgi:hypothetical protein
MLVYYSFYVLILLTRGTKSEEGVAHAGLELRRVRVCFERVLAGRSTYGSKEAVVRGHGCSAVW